jgi:hypothetical protein
MFVTLFDRLLRAAAVLGSVAEQPPADPAFAPVAEAFEQAAAARAALLGSAEAAEAFARAAARALDPALPVGFAALLAEDPAVVWRADDRDPAFEAAARALSAERADLARALSSAERAEAVAVRMLDQAARALRAAADRAFVAAADQRAFFCSAAVAPVAAFDQQRAEALAAAARAADQAARAVFTFWDPDQQERAEAAAQVAEDLALAALSAFEDLAQQVADRLWLLSVRSDRDLSSARAAAAAARAERAEADRAFNLADPVSAGFFEAFDPVAAAFLAAPAAAQAVAAERAAAARDRAAVLAEQAAAQVDRALAARDHYSAQAFAAQAVAEAAALAERDQAEQDRAALWAARALLG